MTIRFFSSSVLRVKGRNSARAAVAVQYEITPLGSTLQQPLQELHAWTVAKLPQVEEARHAFDQRNVV